MVASQDLPPLSCAIWPGRATPRLTPGRFGGAAAPRCSGVTDWRVNTHNVYHLMRGGRARWKTANEPCKALKNQGDSFAHTYGHGETPWL